MIIMKFGGTSLGNAKRIREVAKLIIKLKKNQEVVVVVSAISGVTDLLLASAEAAAARNKAKFKKNLEALGELHWQAARKLGLQEAPAAALSEVIDSRLDELKELLDSIYILGEITLRAQDAILSFGERLNIHLVSAAIKMAGGQAEPLEAGSFIVTDNQFGEARPELAKSKKRVKKAILPLLESGITPIITGYIGATPEGTITTLGRGGSDYSATILGFCLEAKEVWIWTDVNGVMTADPRVVKGAHTIAELTYNEAAELSYFGAKVIHPMTMVPAALKGIPIIIKNTFKPELRGTRITAKNSKNLSSSKAIATIGSLSLITVQGKGMLGVPGVAARLFGTIASEKINVLFISQASSEYNISFVVRHNDGRNAVKALQEIFQFELRAKTIETVKIEEGLAITAVVGEGMRGHPGVAGKVFSALGNKKINIMAIAQGSSELNISMVIKEKDVTKAVKSIHDAFHLAKP